MSAPFTMSSKLSCVNTSVASGGGVQLGSETSLTLATIAEIQFNSPISKFALSYHSIIECKSWYQEFKVSGTHGLGPKLTQEHFQRANQAPLCFTSLLILPRRSSLHPIEHLTYAEHRSVLCSTL